MYEDGLKKMGHLNYIATTRDIGKLDRNYTFHPTLSQKSLKIL